MIARRVRAFGARRLGAYAATWIIWGSTYLAIRASVAVVPPFLLAGVRSVAAGSILVAWALARGERRPSRAQVGAAVLTGAMFFLVGHGGLFWAERRVASGPAALMIATEHVWVLLAGSLLSVLRPARRAWAGVAVGLAGVGMLVGSGPAGVDPAGAAVLLLSAAAWGLGTLYFTGPRKPVSQAYAAGVPLLGGGVLLLAASAAAGEGSGFRLSQVTPAAAGALLYLVLFGSVVAFTAYTWLVEREGPARALSFTYVNPLVAVLLGAAVLHEPLTPRIAVAAGAIVVAVALVITGTRGAAEPTTSTAPGNARMPSPRLARTPSAHRARTRRGAVTGQAREGK